MRKEVVQNKLVRQNLVILCEAIKELNVGSQKEVALDFFCDSQIGEIAYAPSTIPSHELVILVVTLDIRGRYVGLKTKESQKLAPQAEALLAEMTSVLKKIVAHLSKVGELLLYQWEAPLEKLPADSIIKLTWHSITRDEAEHLLLKQPVGTYLFRRDSYTATLQEILRRGLKTSVQCYTLSYLDGEGIVRDKTVVQVSNRWAFYDDDPSLSGPKSESPEALIRKNNLGLKIPLLGLNMLAR